MTKEQKEEKEKALKLAREDFQRKLDQELTISTEFGIFLGITQYAIRAIGCYSLDVLAMKIAGRIHDFNYWVIKPLNEYIKTSDINLPQLEAKLIFTIRHDHETRCFNFKVEIHPLFIKSFILADEESIRYPNRYRANTREEYDALDKMSSEDYCLKIIDQLIDQFKNFMFVALLKYKVREYEAVKGFEVN